MASHAKTASIEPRRLSSGDYADRCDDCGTVTRGRTIDELLAATCACQSRRIVRYVAELVCLACGRPIGSISVPRPDSRLLARHRLRCSHCGGMPFVDEFYPVSDYPDLPLLPAKRGRPPGRKPGVDEF
jgi:DNA-directed RNA polymerase subunit RPC12/RpoP